MAARFEANIPGFYEARSLPGVQRAIVAQAARLAAQAGDGFAYSDQQGLRKPQGRWRAIVYPETYQARMNNGRNNRLVRVLGA